LQKFKQQPVSAIRSFVRREGRFTKAQRCALKEFWPTYGIDIAQQTLQLAEIFANTNPTVLDIGFGNGEALAKLAEEFPQLNFLGVEVYRPGVGALLREISDKALQNIRVVNTDAVELLKNNIADTSFKAVLIWFPDPWHKTKHHKRRLIQTEFVKLLANKLETDGELNLATDWQPYATHMQEAVLASKKFHQVQNANVIQQRPETKFERRGEKLGHRVSDLVYKKISQA